VTAPTDQDRANASPQAAGRTLISVDAMGGDEGPAAVVAGCSISAKSNDNIAFVLHGDADALHMLVAKRPELKDRCEIRSTSGVVSMEDKPSQVVRTGKDTSMWSTIESVRSGEASVAVSCGNTGALMAISMIRLRKLPGVNRPAIAVLYPSSNKQGFNVMLDVGADIRADADDLLRFALMGASYARNGMDIDRPRVGLLNVGTEEHKGRSELKDAFDLIRAQEDQAGLDFVGFVEGGDISGNVADVIVTDGFTGNVAIKTGEGTASLIAASQAQNRSAPRQRWCVFGPERYGCEIAWISGCNRRCRSHRACRTTQPKQIQRQTRRARGGHPDPARKRQGNPHMTLRAVVKGCGHYLPSRVVENAEFEKTLDTDDAWIRARSGIERRHFAAEGETTSHMAAAAARAALAQADLQPDDVDAIVLATSTPDLTFPSAATMVQAELGMTRGFAFDVQAVCAGFVFALSNANALILSGQAKRVLVIGAETFSRIMDWTDRSTCVLFGDGAGALLLEAEQGNGTPADRGILATDLNSDGRHRDLLFVDGGTSTGTTGHLRMQGNQVFRHAVEKLSSSATTAMDRAEVTSDDVDWIVPHQANIRIIQGTAIPLALSVGQGRGQIKKGDLLVTEAIGGGLAWGAVVIRW